MDCLIGCFAFCVFIAVTRYILDQQDIKKKNSKSRKKRKQNSEETEGRCIFNDSLSETHKKKSKRTFKVTLINLLKFNAMDEPESDYCTTRKYTEGESDVDM